MNLAKLVLMAIYCESCQICDESDDPNSNIVELTNGCLCCTVQEEFYPVMQELLKRRDNIDCLLIETSGLALPKPLIQAFQWPEIRNSATVDGVVTVVDCHALGLGNLVGDLAAVESQREADPNLDHETPIEELFEDQLACADLVLLTKTDLVAPETLAKVRAWLKQELKPEVKIVAVKDGAIASDLLLGFNAAVEDDLDNRHSHHDHEEEHEHDEDINSIELSLDRSFEPKALVRQLQELLTEQEIYRVKGFVNVPNKPMRLVLQGVGNRFDTFYDRKWQEDEARQTPPPPPPPPPPRLVLIGQHLDREQIEAKLIQSKTLVG